MSFSIARISILTACIELILVFMSSVLGTCGVSTVVGECWLVLWLGSVGGGVLGAADGWRGSCISEPGVLVGGVGFGEGAGVLLPCSGGVGIGLWTPVLIPCCIGDLLRDGGVCAPDLADSGKSVRLRLLRVVRSFVSGVDEVAVETGRECAASVCGCAAA